MPESTLDHSIPYPSPGDEVRGSTSDYLQTDLRDLAVGADAAITAAVATRSPVGHTHTIQGVTGLQAELDAAASTAEWGGVSGKPPEFPPTAHTHTIQSVTGLQDELDALAQPDVVAVAEGIYSTAQATEVATGIYSVAIMQALAPEPPLADIDAGAAWDAYTGAAA